MTETLISVTPTNSEFFFEQLQAQGPDLRAAVRAEFNRRVDAGLPVAGHNGVVALDTASRQELASAVLMAMVDAWPPGGFWRLSDNNNLPLGKEGIIALGTTAGLYYQYLFAARSVLLDMVAAGEYVEPALGWPEPPPFTAPAAEPPAV